VSGTVLVISHTHDVHAADVLQRLAQRGADALLFDTARIPRETSLAISHDPQNGWGGSAQLEGRTLELASVRAVWWRRPQPFQLHTEVGSAEDRGFAIGETHAAVSGLWSLLDAKWINDPESNEKADRKAWQLKAARAAGLTIPRTCITNDPGRARAFIEEEPGEVIYKAFSATERTWRETRVLRRGELAQLDAVKFAPVIFQEYVPARVDLRVTVVGDAIFAAEIHSQATAYKHDFRMAMDQAKIASHRLSPAIEAALHQLMAALGLVYGAIDLRQTPDGDYVFLEVNPAGQWLFIEHRTGQPISDSIASRLAADAA